MNEFLRADEAVSALEYAILAGVVAVGVGGALMAFQDEIDTALTDLTDQAATAPAVRAAQGLPL